MIFRDIDLKSKSVTQTVSISNEFTISILFSVSLSHAQRDWLLLKKEFVLSLVTAHSVWRNVNQWGEIISAFWKVLKGPHSKAKLLFHSFTLLYWLWKALRSIRYKFYLVRIYLNTVDHSPIQNQWPDDLNSTKY